MEKNKGIHVYRFFGRNVNLSQLRNVKSSHFLHAGLFLHHGKYHSVFFLILLLFPEQNFCKKALFLLIQKDEFTTSVSSLSK